MEQAIVVGQRAPEFALPDADGHVLSLADFAGKPLVIFFYPKDDTSGCTAEAVAFSGKLAAFQAAGAAVIGISPDSPASHAKFRTKHDLSVPLGSDESKTVLDAYGVWTEKSMYGRKYMGVERTTVLVAADGTIARIWPKVKVNGHVDEVLAAVEELGAGVKR
jgi:thioredoxin-dependent peroxiredoxin